MASITKMPFDTVIAPAKLKDYLWVWRGKDDKSKMTYTLFEQVALTRDISEKICGKGMWLRSLSFIQCGRKKMDIHWNCLMVLVKQL
jgi:hypothetical protein